METVREDEMTHRAKPIRSRYINERGVAKKSNICITNVIKIHPKFNGTFNTNGLDGAGPSKITLASPRIPCHKNRFKCLSVNDVEVVDDKIPPQNVLYDMCVMNLKRMNILRMPLVLKIMLKVI